MLELMEKRRTSGTKQDRHDLLSGLLDASDQDVDGSSRLTDMEVLGKHLIHLSMSENGI